MAIPQRGTVEVSAKIDINSTGISITFEGLDTDLASLLADAGTYSSVNPIEQVTFDSSTVVIKSTKVLQFTDPPTP